MHSLGVIMKKIFLLTYCVLVVVGTTSYIRNKSQPEQNIITVSQEEQQEEPTIFSDPDIDPKFKTSPCWVFSVQALQPKLDNVFSECMDKTLNMKNYELHAGELCREYMKSIETELNGKYTECIISQDIN